MRTQKLLLLLMASAGLIASAAPAFACPTQDYRRSYLHKSLPLVPEGAVAAEVEILTSKRASLGSVEITGRIISMLRGSFSGTRMKIAPSYVTSCDGIPNVGKIGIVVGHVRSSSQDELTVDPIRAFAFELEALDKRAAQKPGACTLPRPSPTAAIVALALYEGQALSSVALGSQDARTSAIDVVVEPGRRPIYLVIASHDQLVVNVQGATSRVERLALLHRPRAEMGAVGIPRARVSFAEQRPCGLPWEAYETPLDFSQRAMAAALGRSPAAAGGAYAAALVRVSDRAVVVQPAPVAPSASGAAGELLRFYPAGVKRLDARAVISSAPASPYEVLPNAAGIAQLLAAGKIERGTRADVDAWAKAAALRAGSSAQSIEKQRKSAIGPVYIVRRAFRAPANLCGAHAVTFVVPEAVPIPEGQTCHSAVLRPDGRTR